MKLHNRLHVFNLPFIYYVVWDSLLNNLSAGQPISRCLQYLQANEPRMMALPPKDRARRTISNNKMSQLKSLIRRTTAPIAGNIETMKSGTSVRRLSQRPPVLTTHRTLQVRRKFATGFYRGDGFVGCFGLLLSTNRNSVDNLIDCITVSYPLAHLNSY